MATPISTLLKLISIGMAMEHSFFCHRENLQLQGRAISAFDKRNRHALFGARDDVFSDVTVY